MILYKNLLFYLVLLGTSVLAHPYFTSFGSRLLRERAKRTFIFTFILWAQRRINHPLPWSTWSLIPSQKNCLYLHSNQE
jgi:hypothetical protein